MFDLLDDDNDGFLNEDEQILFFSIIKAKMLKISKELLVIYEYALFSKLMAAIKDLEKQINSNQNQMRQKIYNAELELYHDIGYDKLEEFFQNYEKTFFAFNTNKKRREEEFFDMRTGGKNTLQGKLSRVTEGLKFKPRKKLREYQTQERLVALEERVEEAQNFRKELKNLNIIEANRLTGLWNNHMINSLKNFEKDTQKLYNHMNVKMSNEQNKLKIKLAKDFDILQKQIALHENDIKRLQNLSTKKAWNRGETLGELYRLKSTLTNQNEIIQNSKKIDIVAQFFKPQEMNTLGKTGFSGQASKKSYLKAGMSTTGLMSDSKGIEGSIKYPSINNNRNKVKSMGTKKQLES